MKRKCNCIVKLALAAGLLGLAACSSQTLYAPDPEPGLGHYGYSELPLDSSRYEVTFTGNYNTAPETVDQYALFRSAELTVAHGFDYFIVEHTRHKSIRFHHKDEMMTIDKIRMMKGDAPKRSNVYDAHEMIAVAGPTIKRGS